MKERARRRYAVSGDVIIWVPSVEAWRWLSVVCRSRDMQAIRTSAPYGPVTPPARVARLISIAATAPAFYPIDATDTDVKGPDVSLTDYEYS